jgi:CheY-like chemotaxis protein
MNRLRILIVDDEPISRMGARLIASGEGHVVLEADSGAAAVRSLAEQDGFDALLLDRHMPGIDGAAVLRMARSQHFGGKVICLTGSGDPAARKALLEEGFDGVLVKPLSAAALRYALAEVAPRTARISTPTASGEGARELMRRAAHAAERAVGALRDALELGDRQAIHDAAHRLGSLALQVGRTHMGGFARSLEVQARRELPDRRLARAELERARARDSAVPGAA